MWLQFLLIILSAYICTADLPTIVRPCRLTDYKCIGDNLAANSNCNLNVKGKLPSVYKKKTFHFDTPAFNASYIDTDLQVKNQDKCYVAEFFFNTHTKKAILGIECRDMELESDRTYIQHRTFREDSFYYFHIQAFYPLLRFTVNLPSMTHMDLCSANIFTDVAILPKLKIDPKTKSTSNYLSRDLSLVYIYERENLHARGKSLTSTFIDSLICDYGCAPAS